MNIQILLSTPETQQITFPAISPKTTCSADFSAGATSSNNTIPLIYTSSDIGVATISGEGLIHIIGPGTANITVLQNGNSLYTAAAPQTQTLTVTAPVAPITTITADPIPACNGTAITFTASVSNLNTNLSYQWQVNGINSGTNNPVFAGSNLADGDLVSCNVTNTNTGCTVPVSSVSNTIKVAILSASGPAPSVSISASANGVYAGTPITFTATPVNAGSDVDYQWQVNGTNAGADSPVFIISTLNNGDKVTCILFVKSGCTSSVSSQQLQMNILQPPSIRIPNAFTPNGDGYNDSWEIPGLADYPGCLVSIYTRYGSVVYQSKGYSKAWDGAFNGKALPTGTYYYLIDLGNNSPQLSGYVAIIK